MVCSDSSNEMEKWMEREMDGKRNGEVGKWGSGEVDGKEKQEMEKITDQILLSIQSPSLNNLQDIADSLDIS